MNFGNISEEISIQININPNTFYMNTFYTILHMIKSYIMSKDHVHISCGK